jgi:putative flippase GtrA
MSRIGFPLKSLRWIPHALTSQLKQVRFNLCSQLLPRLRAQAHNNWRHLVTGYESWFYYEYVWDRTWTVGDENTPEGENTTIASAKTMLMVLWNPHGFHVVTMLPLGESFNASWFIDQNIVPLIQSFFPSGWSPRTKNWWFMLTMCRITIQEWRETFSGITHWRGSLMHLTHHIYLPWTFVFMEK